MDREKELIKYINLKDEALEFWTGLRDVVKIEQKLELLRKEISEAKAELQEIRSKRLEALKQ